MKPLLDSAEGRPRVGILISGRGSNMDAIVQAALQTGINYLTAKTIIFFHRK